MSTLCDLCHAEPHISKRIITDWDGSWIYVGQGCLDRYGEYAISCSQGSLKRAAEVRAAELARLNEV